MKIVALRGRKIDLIELLKETAVCVVIVGVTAILASNIVHSLLATREKLAIYEKSKQENSELRLENIRLLAEQNRVMSNDFIEQAARDRLGYAKEGEVIVVIPEEVLDNVELEAFYRDIVEPAKKAEVQGGVAVWLQFFTDGV